MKIHEDGVEEIVGKYEADYQRWQYIFQKGSHDPFWPDGVNLNLLRTHMVSYQMQLDELCQGHNTLKLPEMPPEMPVEYMAAGREELLQEGFKVLEEYGQSKAYQYIKNHARRLDIVHQSELSVTPVFNYYAALEKALKEEDLVTVRRHCVGKEGYLKAMADCADEIEQVTNSAGYQLTIMDVMEEPDELEI